MCRFSDDHEPGFYRLNAADQDRDVGECPDWDRESLPRASSETRRAWERFKHDHADCTPAELELAALRRDQEKGLEP